MRTILMTIETVLHEYACLQDVTSARRLPMEQKGATEDEQEKAMLKKESSVWGNKKKMRKTLYPVTVKVTGILIFSGLSGLLILEKEFLNITPRSCLFGVRRHVDERGYIILSSRIAFHCTFLHINFTGALTFVEEWEFVFRFFISTLYFYGITRQQHSSVLGYWSEMPVGYGVDAFGCDFQLGAAW